MGGTLLWKVFGRENVHPKSVKKVNTLLWNVDKLFLKTLLHLVYQRFERIMKGASFNLVPYRCRFREPRQWQFQKAACFSAIRQLEKVIAGIVFEDGEERAENAA